MTQIFETVPFSRCFLTKDFQKILAVLHGDRPRKRLFKTINFHYLSSLNNRPSSLVNLLSFFGVSVVVAIPSFPVFPFVLEIDGVTGTPTAEQLFWMGSFVVGLN